MDQTIDLSNMHFFLKVNFYAYLMHRQENSNSFDFFICRHM